jgi:hypothetical protein
MHSAPLHTLIAPRNGSTSAAAPLTRARHAPARLEQAGASRTQLEAVPRMLALVKLR